MGAQKYVLLKQRGPLVGHFPKSHVFGSVCSLDYCVCLIWVVRITFIVYVTLMHLSRPFHDHDTST